MERLVKDLLRLARLDAGQETLDVSAVDTRALVDAVVADLAPCARRRAGSASRSTSAPAPSACAAIPAKLHDVLRNLIANAITYSPEETTIRVDARADRRSRRDRRVGRRAGHSRTRICRACSSVSTASTSRARATRAAPASGWRSSKHLVELHGGDVRAENQAGRGARFTITLPGAPPAPA